MAAAVEIDEINGAGLVATHGIASTYFGSTDAAELDPDGAPVAAGANSYEKVQAFHITDLGGATRVESLRIWSDPRPSGITLAGNLNVIQANYDVHSATSPAQPVTTSGTTPYTVPASEISIPNLGIGGSLTGSLSSPGTSDYAFMQIRLGALVTSGYDGTMHYEYDEVA